MIKTYHISYRVLKSIDITLNDENGTAQIIDSYDDTNKVTISAEDWNELIKKVRAGDISFIGEKKGDNE